MTNKGGICDVVRLKINPTVFNGGCKRFKLTCYTVNEQYA